MADSFTVPGMRKSFGVFAPAAWAPPGRTLYISGQVGSDGEVACVAPGDVRAQTHQLLTNMQKIVEHAGGTMADIASVTVYVTSMANLDAIHEVRAKFFSPPYPSSTLVQVVALVRPELLVEISAIAIVPQK